MSDLTPVTELLPTSVAEAVTPLKSKSLWVTNYTRLVTFRRVSCLTCRGRKDHTAACHKDTCKKGSFALLLIISISETDYHHVQGRSRNLINLANFTLSI